MAVVLMRLYAFAKYRDYMQLGRALPEFILGVIYAVDSFLPFETIDRIILIRNTIMLIFSVELFYQAIIVPKMRGENHDEPK